MTLDSCGETNIRLSKSGNTIKPAAKALKELGLVILQRDAQQITQWLKECVLCIIWPPI